MRAELSIVVEEDSNLMIDSPPGNPVLQEPAKALGGLEEWQSAPRFPATDAACGANSQVATSPSGPLLTNTHTTGAHCWALAVGVDGACSRGCCLSVFYLMSSSYRIPSGFKSDPKPSFSHSLPPTVHMKHLESCASMCHLRDTEQP